MKKKPSSETESKAKMPYYETLSKAIIAKDQAYREIIGRNLRAIREHYGWTQSQAGDMTGLHRTRISELESGRWSSTVLTLIQISSAYGVTIEELFRPDTAGKYVKH